MRRLVQRAIAAAAAGGIAAVAAGATPAAPSLRVLPCNADGRPRPGTALYAPFGHLPDAMLSDPAGYVAPDRPTPEATVPTKTQFAPR